MKRTLRTILGVTLLEIMLVLAVAAMVVVMSIKYYQSANVGQQTVAVISQIQAIAAAADGVAQSSGTYSGVNSATIQGVLGPKGLKTPWNTDVTVGTGTATSMKATFTASPPGVCQQVSQRLKANAGFAVDCASTSFGVNYGQQ